jgi:site-specific DNA-adenine methylase
MAKYGMPYMGSKGKIADWVIDQLPSGKRLVDLFGGGGAISHCAKLSGKWDTVLYNELNPLVCEVLQDAMDGKYSYDVFKPEWVSREEFMAKRDTCGYIRCIWSFGNNGRGYLFGKDIEEYKRMFHQMVVFGDYTDNIYPDLHIPDELINIKERRLWLKKWVREKLGSRTGELQQLERLERLQQLERLERLERLQQLEQLQVSNKSYLDVELHDGDVIYCDPPYAGTAKYSKDGFNHAEFWQWVRDCPHCVVVSEYSAPEDIQLISSIAKISLLKSGSAPRKTKQENLYWNGKGNIMAGTLF